MSHDDETKPPSEYQRLLTNPPPRLPNHGNLPESTTLDEYSTHPYNSPHFDGRERARASRYPEQASTCRNSLEKEIIVNPKDRHALITAIILLSNNQEPSTSANGQFLTWRESTIKNLQLPEPTARALYALVTNAFTPVQLVAAGQIQRFLNNHPAEPIPRHFISEEIAEIHGNHGWCLIGKCGLARISFKITRPTSASIATENRLEEDHSRKDIQSLSIHIRDSHFKQTPFPCLLCPASFDSEVSNLWRYPLQPRITTKTPAFQPCKAKHWGQIPSSSH
ncbi:SubName: Full=Uncharacterized protein {ECO:0000313/EMBL:CCA72357.1} [Serendipita indica DSM 11827]|nr:SubName: Full=Uncharacterized protein {ECO:0000313/EMBL:CCA72357.1} [Serendipita indica DSM 11827]